MAKPNPPKIKIIFCFNLAAKKESKNIKKNFGFNFGKNIFAKISKRKQKKKRIFFFYRLLSTSLSLPSKGGEGRELFNFGCY